MPDTIPSSLAILILGVSLVSCAAPAGDPSSLESGKAPIPASRASADAAEPAAPPAGAASGEAAARPGVVIGRVLQIDEPRAGNLVQLMRKDGLLLQATVDERGEYQIGDVPPGEYLLHVVDIPAIRAGVMTMKSRGISVGPGELVEENFVFGTGFRVHGPLEGIPPGTAKLQVALYRPGAPRLEGTLLSDRALQIEATQYLAGSAYIENASSYEIFDVEPGSYRLVLTIPPDPATPRHATWDPPLYEGAVTIEKSDVEWPIVIERP